MPAPVISASSSILGFKRNERFAFTMAATNDPLIWAAVGLPSTVTIDTPENLAATGVASTDVVTATGHDFVNGSLVYFSAITGGAGLTANTIYFVRDLSGATFKLAATATGPAMDFTTDISAGTIRRVSNGTISGYFETAGPKVVTVSATNSAPATGSREFVFGISPEIAPALSGSTSAEWDFDVETREVTVARGAVVGAAAPAAGSTSPLAWWKSGDVFIVRVRFRKNGIVVDPDATSLKLALKEIEPEAGIDLSTNFVRIGTGEASYCDLLVDLTDAAVVAALANYEADAGTFFEALTELQMEHSVTHNSATVTLRLTSRSFPVRLDRDMIA